MSNSVGEIQSLIIKSLGFYNIGRFERIIEIIKNEKSMHLIVIFQTNKEKFVFKAYRRHQEDKESKKIKKIEELKNSLYLASKISSTENIKIPLCLTKNGESYLEIDDELISIDEYVENNTKLNEVEFNEVRMINIAKLLGNLHSTDIQLPLDYEKVIDKFFNQHFNSISKLLVEENNLEQKIQEKRYKSEMDSCLLNEVLPFIRKEFESLTTQKEKIQNQMKRKKNPFLSLIHGDFNPNQMLFNDVEVAGLIDYETMQLSIIEFDIGRALFTYPKFENKKGYDLESVKIFLSEYKKAFGVNIAFNPQEVLFFIRITNLRIFTFILRTYVRGTNQEYLFNILYNIFYSKLKWLRENEDYFIKALS